MCKGPGLTDYDDVAAAAGAGSEGGKVGKPPDQDEHSCRVCLEDYSDGEELRVLPCFHRFHKSCIDEWLQRKKLCPLCQIPVDIILKQASEYT
jgi:hypothetical protein